MLFKYLPKELIDGNPNETELFVKLKNGSIIALKGADNPDSMRGQNPRGVIFDEYGDIAARWGSEVWDAIVQPILRANGGWAWFIGTPKGANHFHQLFSRGNTEIDGWKSFLFKASQTDIFKPEELEEAKRSSTQAFYNQEYECSFEEGAGAVFRRIEQNIHHEEGYPQAGKQYRIGADLAKYNDWSVYTPFDLHNFYAYLPYRSQKVDWDLQFTKLSETAKHWNSALIMADATGIGDNLVERLQNDHSVSVEGIKISGQNREQILTNLALLLEQDRIKIPNYEPLINELKAFHYELTERGRTTIRVPENMNDDCVFSLALAVWGISTPLPYNPYGQESNIIVCPE